MPLHRCDQKPPPVPPKCPVLPQHLLTRRGEWQAVKSAQGLPRIPKLTIDDADEPQHSPVGPLPLGQCPCAVPAPECCWSWSQSGCSQGMDAVGGVEGEGTARPSPASPSFPRQAGRQETGRQEGRGAATLEDTAPRGGGEPKALPWLCWLGNPHPVRVLTAAKGLLPTLSRQGAPPSWRKGHLQVPASPPGR